MDNIVGLGSSNARINIYMQNRPPLQEYQYLNTIKPMLDSEVAEIGRLTGNHWRKIFNVFAKLLFELDELTFTSWQDLRDQYLLQQGSREALIFSQPSFMLQYSDSNLLETESTVISIIMGKTYAQQLLKGQPDFAMNCLHWVSADFAISKAHKLIICPYFDYRQLSNIKIAQLVLLIKSLSNNVVEFNKFNV